MAIGKTNIADMGAWVDGAVEVIEHIDGTDIGVKTRRAVVGSI